MIHDFHVIDYQISDPKIRQVEEKDVEHIIELFKLNYGDDYPITEFYDERWVKKNIYSDNVIWLVLEEDGMIAASGAIILDYGDYNDQIGELGRLVVHPKMKKKGLGRRIVDTLIEATHYTVECALGFARTAHPVSQKLLEEDKFTACGFLPNAYLIGDNRESVILYQNLYGNGKDLRSKDTVLLIPEIEELAAEVLKEMDFPINIKTTDNAAAFNILNDFNVRKMEREDLINLLDIRGKNEAKYIFGSLSIDQGFAYLKIRGAKYITLTNNGNILGAIGYKHSKANSSVKIIELIADNEKTAGTLCKVLIDKTKNELDTAVVEADISAYNPGIQKTLLSHGFFSAAYLPAMIFDNSNRYDVIRMFKLNKTYKEGAMKLTESSKKIINFVKPYLTI